MQKSGVYVEPSSINQTTQINNGQSISGSLSMGYEAGAYLFSANAGQLATITMNANFDAVLHLHQTNSITGSLIAFDDDSGGGYNSRISNFALPTTGNYVIECKSYNNRQRGAYTVNFQVSGSAVNECQTFQDMIDRLPASGGKVSLPSGTFTCGAPLVIDRDNVTLAGQGPSTIFRLASGANSPVIVIGQISDAPTVTRRNIIISDLVIDGNRANQTYECWGGDCASHPIRNNGITIRRASDVLIERITVGNARSGGLVSERGCERLTVRDFTAFGSQFDGLAAYVTQNSRFSGLYLHDNDAAGLSFDLQFNNNLITDSVLTSNKKVGIFARDAKSNVFHSLQIRDSGEHGVFLAQVDNDATRPASGNTFSAITISGSRGAGLRVNDPSCVNNLVVACQFVGNAQGCISEPISLVQVAGNVCR